MGLQTSGEVSVAVPRDAAFGFLQDAERLAACIPGCSDLRALAPADLTRSAPRYSAVLTSRVAFLTVKFNVTIDIVRSDPPNAIEAAIAGDAIGLPGHVVAKAAVMLADIVLSDAGAQQTLVRYTTDITLTGKLGGIGQPVFRATSSQLAREFGENLKRALEARPTQSTQPIPIHS
jgi:carbon monoxide dehydrogenase subunit G